MRIDTPGGSESRGLGPPVFFAEKTWRRNELARSAAKRNQLRNFMKGRVEVGKFAGMNVRFAHAGAFVKDTKKIPR